MAENFNKKLEVYFKKRKNCKISSRERSTKASVAVILKNVSDQLFVLFIRRTEIPGDTFSGHVAFPGGKMNVDDTDSLQTAVRETYEEIGINLNDHANYLGRMDDIKPLNPDGPKFIVSPFIFILNNKIPFRINSHEVDECMWISFKHLIDRKNMRIRYKEREGKVIEDYVYRYRNFLIWGMTGRIINAFAKEVSVIL